MRMPNSQPRPDVGCTSERSFIADVAPLWDQNRDAHFDARRELFGPRRAPAESMALTALVLVALTVASSVGAALITAVLYGSGHDAADATDSWAGLGTLIIASLICAGTVPIVATMVLHVLRVPRPGTAMLATIVTVIADTRGPQLFFGAPGSSVFAYCLIAIVIAAGWVGALHPAVWGRLLRRR